jgi:hypothetical protein
VLFLAGSDGRRAMRQHTIRRVIRGAPVFRITSEDLDDAESNFFDEVQAEVDAGFPEGVKLDRRETVATTRSSSPFYQLPHDRPRRAPHRPVLKPWPLVRQMPPTSKTPGLCRSCNTYHQGECW